MREILNIYMQKVYVNYKSLFIERQCYIFTSLTQGSCAVATSSLENRSNKQFIGANSQITFNLFMTQ